MTSPRQFATALYGRTSKDDPRTVTIEIQQARLRDWSTRDTQVGRVTDEYWDQGVSGKIPLWERPHGRRLIEDIKAGKAQAVAVLYVDRFGRTLLDGLQAATELEKLGVKIVAVDDGWDARRSDSPLFFQFKLMMAEEEHRRICERMRNGKLRAMERDNAPPGGPLKFGYRLDQHGRFVPDPLEAPIVIRIFEMFLEGHSQYQILAWVQTTGVRAGRRTQKRDAHAEPSICVVHAQARWHQSSIRQILRSRVYLGERRWGNRVFPCVPLIDQETWDRAQAILATRDNGSGVGTGYHPGGGLLSGLMQCGECGDRYYHRRQNSRGHTYHYYACNLIRRTGQPCHAKQVRMDQLDTDVWELIESYLKDPENLVRKVIAADTTATLKTDNLAQLENRHLASLQAIEIQVTEIWAEQQAQNWPTSWVTPKLNQLNAQCEGINAQLTEIRRQKANILVDQTQTQAVTAALARIRARLQAGLTEEEKYEIIRLVVAGGLVRTIGSGNRKQAEVTIQLKWGEVASPSLVKNCFITAGTTVAARSTGLPLPASTSS